MVCNHSGKVGMKDPQRVSNLRKFKDNYDWSGLEFPVSIKDIGKFETRNNISVNVLAVEGRDIYIHRKGRRMGREINLLMVSEDGINHYTAIKSLSRLLSGKNSNTKRKQHFCMNCFQGFTQESSRDQHQVYCENNQSGVEWRCLNRVQPLSSKMDRINLESHL